MQNLFSDPQIVAAMISGGCTVVASIFASVAAASVGKKILARQQLEQDFRTAIGDIHFLLAAERRHCELNKEAGRPTNKLKVRDHVRANTP